MIAASLLAALFVTLTAAPREARADASEDKANLVAAFLKDVTFPGAVLARAKGVPTFAVLGEDELAIALTSSISAIDIAGKPVFVKFVRKPTDVAGAHVVFIASSAYAQVGEAIAAAGGALTIADNPGFIAAGGMLSFAGGRLNVAKAKVASAGYKVGVKALAAVQ
jgi:hypothetical protein